MNQTEETETLFLPDGNEKIFAVLLDILKQFDRVCSENGLRYFAHGGTLLGAIRHKGFIPWDDDIDLFMPRKDFDILPEIAPKAFQPPYFFQSYITDPGYFRTQVRIRNSDTTCIAKTDIGMRCNQGIFISIFPLDAIPDGERERQRHKRKVDFYRKIMMRYVYTNEPPTSKKMVAFRVFAKLVCDTFGGDTVYRRLQRICGKYADRETEHIGLVCLLTYRPEQLRFMREDYAETLYVDFGDIKIPVPAGYDRVLTTQYGDYQTPVKDTKRWAPHSLILDTEKPYTYYWERPQLLERARRGEPV